MAEARHYDHDRDQDHTHNDDRVNVLVLWFGVLAAPIAWAIHLMVVYPWVHIACERGSRVGLHLASAVALAVAILGAIVAYSLWKKLEVGILESMGGQAGRVAFMSMGGLVMAMMMALGIVYAWIPIFVLDPCA
jgi:hypothetical protein